MIDLNDFPHIEPLTLMAAPVSGYFVARHTPAVPNAYGVHGPAQGAVMVDIIFAGELDVCLNYLSETMTAARKPPEPTCPKCHKA